MEIKVSVRNIVEFAYKSGSIDSGYVSMNAAQEGSKAHRAIQKQREREVEEYLAEISISLSIIRENVTLTVMGRIDGIIKQNGQKIIEEIKTTNKSINEIYQDDNPVHLAQAKCYAYMYMLQQNIEQIGIQMTYYNRADKMSKSFIEQYSFDELENFWIFITEKYLKWATLVSDWNDTRDKSIDELQFPFAAFRKGQRELAVAAYKSIKDKKNLFARAPTGIGKTIATIFPSIKSIGEGSISKIFYLTAKTSTRAIAEEAFDRLRDKGLKFRTVTITAKEKMCQMDKIACKPEECPFADGYYDRVDNAIEDIFGIENFTKGEILTYAKKHMVCPFEYSLDLSLFCDGIICDYNYVFDPRVYLKRFFNEVKEDYVFLIDEAHNLVDRGREMFSAGLNKSEFLELKKAVPKEFKALRKSLSDINKYFIDQRKLLDERKTLNIVCQENNEELRQLIDVLLQNAEYILERNPKIAFKEQLLDVYFNSVNFVKISDLYDENYTTYIEKESHEVKYKLFCINPSRLLAEGMKRGIATILFSATLTPLDYYMNILGGSSEDYRVTIDSPFDSKNLCVMIANNIMTTYKARENSYAAIAEHIAVITGEKTGNYIAFFPSYKYLNEVHKIFCEKYSNLETLIQRSDMNEEEREQFLKKFDEPSSSSMIGFAVMGGAFGEGIDLTGDRLIGAIIVGVGLPMMCLERDIIKNHFGEINNMGFEYSYVYPGINKVLQAVGRVIRTEQDKGVVLLIDERFTRRDYKALLPREWATPQIIHSVDRLKETVTKFWE